MARIKLQPPPMWVHPSWMWAVKPFSSALPSLPILSSPMVVVSLLLGSISALGQQTSGQQTPLPDAPHPQGRSGQSSPKQTGQPDKPSKGRILWVIPNYRADEETDDIKPMTARAKLKVAFDDSFDPSSFLVAGAFAGISMAQNQYGSFGQGAQGYAKYYGGAFADQAIGNTMTEALFPIALHQDPRYFVKGKGGFWTRTKYAVSREVVTRGDKGQKQFNTSELAGNAVAAGISNLYYPAADRSLGNTTKKWGQQIAVDALFNVMKEFWPDVRDKFFHQ